MKSNQKNFERSRQSNRNLEKLPAANAQYAGHPIQTNII